MPLKRGKSPAVVSENIRREVRAGRPVKQAAAIAYSVAGRSRALDLGEKLPRKSGERGRRAR
jgi:hypothetical protein